MTSHGAARVDWQTWTLPLSYFTPNLKSVTPGAKGVTVKWNKLANAKGYEVWRSVGNGKLTKVKTISAVLLSVGQIPVWPTENGIPTVCTL